MNKIEIDYDVFQKNLNVFSSKKVCAMVKANGYGLGLEKIVPFLENKVNFFGVCCLDEAFAVKNLSKKTPIIITSPCNANEINICVKNGFNFIVENLSLLRYVKEKNFLNMTHLKFNVGMNRFGFPTDNLEIIKDIKKIVKDNHIAGICTHFPCLNNKEITRLQYEKFKKVKNILQLNTITHFGGSEVINYDFDFDMIRVGIGLYDGKVGQIYKIVSYIYKVENIFRGKLGYGGKFKINNKKIALVPVGYADGLLKCYQGCFAVISGKKCNIIGEICMDYCFIDITNIDCKEGDRVELISDINEVIKKTNLSRYEIITNFNKLRMR